jgi:hypothetical protein
MTQYRCHVALMVPDASQQAANMIVRDTTGNPADIHSFSIECTDEHGATWWACQMPMTHPNYARLPEIQVVVGGHYELLREYAPARVDRMTFDAALALHGLTRTGGIDE